MATVAGLLFRLKVLLAEGVARRSGQWGRSTRVLGANALSWEVFSTPQDQVCSLAEVSLKL